MNSVPLLAWPSAFSLNGQWLTSTITWPQDGSTSNNQADSTPSTYMSVADLLIPREQCLSTSGIHGCQQNYTPQPSLRGMPFKPPAAASRLSMTTFMFHESGKRPPFDSIQLRQCVFLDMCIIDMDNDFRIKIPNGDMIEKSIVISVLPFPSILDYSLPPCGRFPPRSSFQVERPHRHCS